MAILKVKGHEFEEFVARDSFTRRAVQFKNAILISLRKLGIPENQTDIILENAAFKKASASALWFFNGHRMFYSYSNADKYVDNLYVVSKVIENEVSLVITDQKPVEEFVYAFSEDKDVSEQRLKARELLGVDASSKDLDEINKKYKELAKKHHPDTPTGDLDRFKEVNQAHKVLKRELE